MYTGIITGTFPITALDRRPGAASFGVALDDAHREDLRIGASVSLAGVCMTVTRLDEAVWFDASRETLARTTLGQLEVGDLINVERSARAGAEIGGHPISGHIDGMAEVLAVDRPENNCVLTVQLPLESVRYVFNKGFIALNGCSLTVSELERSTARFKVWLIPETLRLTTYDAVRPGDRLNYEIDRQTQVIVDTIREALGGVLEELKSSLRA
jgi:riboflavin synthase